MKQDLVELDNLKKEIIIRKRNCDYSLRGKTGFCFIKGNIVIKLYEYPKDIKNFCDLSMFKSDLISFPLDYIYENGKIIGEILPFYKGKTLDNALNIRSNIDSIVNHFNNIIEELDRFNNLAMYDMWTRNILYSSKNGMFLIDTTDWKIKDDCFFDNLELLENSMASVIKKILYDDKMEFDTLKDYSFLRKNESGRNLFNI